MPMSADRCLSNFKTAQAALIAAAPASGLTPAQQGDTFIKALYQGWIDELHANAQVSVTTTGSATTQSCTNGTIA